MFNVIQRVLMDPTQNFINHGAERSSFLLNAQSILPSIGDWSICQVRKSIGLIGWVGTGDAVYK